MIMHLFNDVDGNAEVKGRAKTKALRYPEHFRRPNLSVLCDASRSFDKTKRFSAFNRHSASAHPRRDSHFRLIRNPLHRSSSSAATGERKRIQSNPKSIASCIYGLFHSLFLAVSALWSLRVLLVVPWLTLLGRAAVRCCPLHSEGAEVSAESRASINI